MICKMFVNRAFWSVPMNVGQMANALIAKTLAHIAHIPTENVLLAELLVNIPVKLHVILNVQMITAYTT